LEENVDTLPRGKTKPFPWKLGGRNGPQKVSRLTKKKSNKHEDEGEKRELVRWLEERTGSRERGRSLESSGDTQGAAKHRRFKLASLFKGGGHRIITKNGVRTETQPESLGAPGDLLLRVPGGVTLTWGGPCCLE